MPPGIIAPAGIPDIACCIGFCDAGNLPGLNDACCTIERGTLLAIIALAAASPEMGVALYGPVTATGAPHGP